ncbi:probable CCR4-associated factor 1 homolog 7 [Tanacetum coccineum]|uniref:poly(A)-specific ribonuclease n=1 Tax=Tanacetum coccineum TaxID=301880 RepID=A0ABQ4YVP3_9ASTR
MANEQPGFEFREVWSDNLEQEFTLIQEIVDKYTNVAMDTEFPGVVVKPTRPLNNEETYLFMRTNVGMCKLIQLGLTFSDENGNHPTCGSKNCCVWQFNFRDFNLDEDYCNTKSIDLLKKSGIDFKKNRRMGVESEKFGELLMSSGVVLNEDICWATFHGGYDFGYLIKLLTGKNLPETQEEFFELMNVFFPIVYDIKHMIKFHDVLRGGLSNVARTMGIQRFGVSHQSGSDSLLTCHCFKKLKECSYLNKPLETYMGRLSNLGVEDVVQNK